MDKGIYISIKPEHIQRIVTGEKNYEFRKYLPKREFNKLYVYVTSSVSVLKYIIIVGDIIKYPDQIEEDGYGNKEFNFGNKIAKYAYQIKEVYKLDNPIELTILRNNYGFVAPQGYVYDDKYLELTEYINSLEIKKIRS